MSSLRLAHSQSPLLSSSINVMPLNSERPADDGEQHRVHPGRPAAVALRPHVQLCVRTDGGGMAGRPRHVRDTRFGGGVEAQILERD